MQNLKHTVASVLEDVGKDEPERSTHTVNRTSPLFFIEEFDEFIADSRPMLGKNFEDIGRLGDNKFELNEEAYRAIEKAGSLKVFTARKSGELVGYNIFFVVKSIRTNDFLIATQDTLYVDPGERGFGYKFLKWCDNKLKDMKIDMIVRQVTEHQDYSPLLKRMGYGKSDVCYTRRF